MKDARRDDEKLPQAWSAPGPGGGAEACPTDDEIWDAARGLLAAPRRAEILDHAVRCRLCSASLSLAAELGRQAPQGPSRARRPVRVYVLAGLAAATILLAAGLALFRRSAVTASPHLTGAIGRHVRASLWKDSPAGGTPLGRGDRVQPGDRLYVRLDNDVPVNLYIINTDATGETNVLFPVEGAEWSNPVPPGEARRVPGGRDWKYDSWEVSSAGGEESFVVVASLAPVKELETALRGIQAAAPRNRVRDGTPAPKSVPSKTSSRALREALAEIRSSAGRGANLLIEEIVLENPR